MSALWNAVCHFAMTKPNDIAIVGSDEVVTWHNLMSRVSSLAAELSGFSNQVIALYADNGPNWIVIDLACHIGDITLLPLPSFFSEQQLCHALQQSGTHAIIHAAKDNAYITKLASRSKLKSTTLSSLSLPLILCEIGREGQVKLPNNTRKITFTSGSTGDPKGVCLSHESQTNTAQALIAASKLSNIRHLAILPFSTLLENIAGIYAPLLSGGCIIALTQFELGFNGSQGFILNKLLTAMTTYQPSSFILLPELLTALLAAMKQGWTAPKSIDFIAVGGSRVSQDLLRQAEMLRLPVYQGYGLSECTSVVSMNTAKHTAIDSTGQVLKHVEITIEQGEVVVSGNIFLGYIGQEENWYPDKVYTGDLGFYDEQHYLHITGRKKNLLVSSFGRNINPEWVESELLANGLLSQCVVFGDAEPFCIALILPRNDATSESDIEQWIAQVNQGLPDYAQIKIWHILASPLSAKAGLITRNGRPVRHAIADHYHAIIKQLYQGEHYAIL